MRVRLAVIPRDPSSVMVTARAAFVRMPSRFSCTASSLDRLIRQAADLPRHHREAAAVLARAAASMAA